VSPPRAHVLEEETPPNGRGEEGTVGEGPGRGEENLA